MKSFNQEKRFLIVSIVPHSLPESQAFINIKELISLVETYGGEVVDIVLQNREVHDKGMYIGKGKIEEVSQLIKENDIEVVLLNAIVKPGQIYEMHTIFEKQLFGIQVWDRVDLILKIFSKQANSAEAKLQIELAAMRHMGPRIYGMGEEMSRQGGMVGTRGIGETNTERMKRHWRNQIKKVTDDLKRLSEKRQQQLDQRRKIGLQTVSLVGYTNAGKTSLFNLLTQKNKLVKDAFFATLESSVGKIYLPPTKREVLLSDTIGFIRDLPPQLIDAFQSTLLESIHADIIVHVIDCSDPDLERKISVVGEILQTLKLQHKKQLYVFNKTDQANGINKSELVEKYAEFDPLFVSVKTGTGIHELQNSISNHLQN